MAKPGGYLVVSQLSWLRLDPPAEIRDFWAGNCPAMRDVEANPAAARKARWRCLGHFHLPAEAWTDHDGPLKQGSSPGYWRRRTNRVQPPSERGACRPPWGFMR